MNILVLRVQYFGRPTLFSLHVFNPRDKKQETIKTVIFSWFNFPHESNDFMSPRR